jgi:hypothetical protein
MSCGQQNSSSSTELKTISNDSMTQAIIQPKVNIEFQKYVSDGIFLKGKVRLFDSNMKNIGELDIDSIIPVEILEKSPKMYNVEGQTANCEKAIFLRVKYLDKDYVVFGQDVYEINKQQRYTTQSDEKGELTLFPITNFEMGASDEDGLTGCDDYSLLVLFNGGHYTLMKYPMNEDIHGNATSKFACIFHDDGSEENIYNLSVNEDTLVIGIKAFYQEGGSIFKLKANLSSKFPETFISDRIRFETDEELKKMDEIK